MCGFPPAEGRKRRKTFFSHAAGSMDSSAWGVSGHVRSSRFTLRLPSDIAWHPPTHPTTHAWSVSRVGLSLCVHSFASLPKFECNFFRWNQLLIMYSFLLVFLDSVSSSWPVFVLLYLSFCVNKGQAACSAWHGSQLCVRKNVHLPSLLAGLSFSCSLSFTRAFFKESATDILSFAFGRSSLK